MILSTVLAASGSGELEDPQKSGVTGGLRQWRCTAGKFQDSGDQLESKGEWDIMESSWRGEQQVSGKMGELSRGGKQQVGRILAEFS